MPDIEKELDRCIAEQADARDRAVSGDAGACLGVSDWSAEEAILRKLYEERALGGKSS